METKGPNVDQEVSINNFALIGESSISSIIGRL
ncbi:hypothetical protein Patl1_34866 [Pistacia atlantica]|uniref:Uncharacterized protein n=1 Tax=Pistacia atlantica TaxID=434234 RepID=A0ACC0ZSV3_9ROSI|nr:hypothetical protein Patl1_34866 [Pistacia atlantica]